LRQAAYGGAFSYTGAEGSSVQCDRVRVTATAYVFAIAVVSRAQSYVGYVCAVISRSSLSKLSLQPSR
jgi:hypothetical protein